MQRRIRIDRDDPWKSLDFTVYCVQDEYYATTPCLEKLLGIDRRRENSIDRLVDPKTGQKLAHNVYDVFSGRNKKFIPKKHADMGALMPLSQLPTVLQVRCGMSAKDAAAAYARFEKCARKQLDDDDDDDEEDDKSPPPSSEEKKTSPPRKRERSEEDLGARVAQLDATIKEMSVRAYYDTAEFQERVRMEVARQAAAIIDKMSGELLSREDLFAADLEAFRVRREKEIEAEIRADPKLHARCEESLRAEVFDDEELIAKFTEELRQHTMTRADLIAECEREVRDKAAIQAIADTLLGCPRFWASVGEKRKRN